jgi:acetyltransferase-like isoleucine patch superfamily enzyme
MKRIIIFLFLSPFPWVVRRFILQKLFGYQIHPTAFISRFALISPNILKMAENSKIGAFTVAIHLDQLDLHKQSSISRSNWISGFPKGSKKHFIHVTERDPSMTLGEHSAITKKHIIDCTHTITIGRYTTIAGYQSQFLTHSIDYLESRQDCSTITIGDYCLVGTGSIFLPGSSLPDYSICGAGSVVNKSFTEAYALYAGSPAVFKKSLKTEAKYFLRKTGYII